MQVAGTGVSGSVAGLNPTTQVFLAGYYPMATTFRTDELCDNPFSYESLPIYTPTGVIAFGSTLYANEAGTILYTGYRTIYVTDFCNVYSIDPSTATVNDFGTICQNCI